MVQQCLVTRPSYLQYMWESGGLKFQPQSVKVKLPQNWNMSFFFCTPWKKKKTETGSHMHNKTQPTNYIISFSDLYNWLIYTNINYKMSFHFCT